MTTLRVLLVATAIDGSGHACLLPSDTPAPPAGREDEAFRCACGAVYPAWISNLSRTTEYTPRCLVRMAVFTDHRVRA